MALGKSLVFWYLNTYGVTTAAALRFQVRLSTSTEGLSWTLELPWRTPFWGAEPWMHQLLWTLRVTGKKRKQTNKQRRRIRISSLCFLWGVGTFAPISSLELRAGAASTVGFHPPCLVGSASPPMFCWLWGVNLYLDPRSTESKGPKPLKRGPRDKRAQSYLFLPCLGWSRSRTGLDWAALGLRCQGF